MPPSAQLLLCRAYTCMQSRNNLISVGTYHTIIPRQFECIPSCTSDLTIFLGFFLVTRCWLRISFLRGACACIFNDIVIMCLSTVRQSLEKRPLQTKLFALILIGTVLSLSFQLKIGTGKLVVQIKICA